MLTVIFQRIKWVFDSLLNIGIVHLSRHGQLVRLYYYLLSFSIITRWLLFIVPLLAILWIPGILHFTRFPNAEVSLYVRQFICTTAFGDRYGVLDFYGGQYGLVLYGLVCSPSISSPVDYLHRVGWWIAFIAAYINHYCSSRPTAVFTFVLLGEFCLPFWRTPLA